jgi:hypothetical protein
MNNSIAIALDQHDKQKEALAAWHGLSMSILSAANVAARRCLRGDDWCIKWPKAFGGDQRFRRPVAMDFEWRDQDFTREEP